MKKLVVLLVAVLFFSLPVFGADFDAAKNNKFGIHLAQPSNEDIIKAAELVNASGGRWGYVTLVIQDNDRNVGKWQETFERLRELRLIPIIRLATHGENGNWTRATVDQADSWVNFLESLRWVVKNRYVILFNETNHATEWGGGVDPEGYATVAQAFAKKFKEKNSNYVVMLAGLDASAPSSSPWYEDEGWYLRRVVNKVGISEFNALFSALSSHSYPNPGFVGSPYATGRGTVRTYEWELDFLRGLGIKDLPVFITETGWDESRIGKEEVANFFQAAFEAWGRDNRVVAITPFVLNYPAAPFANFSWIAPDGSLYPHFDRISRMAKIVGSPAVVEDGTLFTSLPHELAINSTYHFVILLRNTGESIWKSDEYRLEADRSLLFILHLDEIPTIRPGESKEVDVTVTTNDIIDKDTIRLYLKRGESTVMESVTWSFATVPLPSLEFHVSFYPRLHAEADDVEIQLFDAREQMVFKQKNIAVHSGIGLIDGVSNVAGGQKYRVVVLRPHFLPSQNYLTLKRGENKLGLGMLVPLDFNNDGKFDFGDIVTLLGDLKMIGYLIPSAK